MTEFKFKPYMFIDKLGEITTFNGKLLWRHATDEEGGGAYFCDIYYSDNDCFYLIVGKRDDSFEVTHITYLSIRKEISDINALIFGAHPKSLHATNDSIKIFLLARLLVNEKDPNKKDQLIKQMREVLANVEYTE